MLAHRPLLATATRPGSMSCDPWLVNVEIDGDGFRRYAIGNVDVTDDMLHVRYRSRVGDAHGHGPLEVGAGRLGRRQRPGPLRHRPRRRPAASHTRC